jgi:desampylase
MALQLSRKHHRQLLQWALDAGEEECCGLLLGQGVRVIEIERTRNVAPVPRNGFEIDPAALIAAYRRARQGGLGILGYFHSHPNGSPHPSSADVAQAADDGRYWLIIANRNITAWQPEGVKGQVTVFQPISLLVEG